MNKLTKIGVSALCGSLASVAAANAGSLDVTGGADATYTSLDGDVTGNPLGMATSMTFTGNGELDNGSTVKLTIAHANKVGYSTSAIAVTTPSKDVYVAVAPPVTSSEPALAAATDARDPHNADTPIFVSLFIISPS